MRRNWVRPGGNKVLPGRNDGGFSLAEILVVLAVIAVVLLAVLPNFGDFARAWKIRSEADDMQAKIRGVRQMAVSMHQPLTITFTPAPTNTFSYFHPIKKTTVTITLPGGMTMTTNPTSSFAPVFNVNGSITNTSSPSPSAPTSNFVRISAIINGSRTDKYTFGFSPAGQITYTVSH
jgi:prepilin-type N-terminal cleavage/methylation domain-containing protein